MSVQEIIDDFFKLKKSNLLFTFTYSKKQKGRIQKRII